MDRIRDGEVAYELTVYPEDTPVRGYACATDEPELDRAEEDVILKRLDRGDTWAWCLVQVTAYWRGFQGTAGLGCCSYADEKDFKAPDGYYEDMKAEALDDLRANVADVAKRLGCDAAGNATFVGPHRNRKEDTMG